MSAIAGSVSLSAAKARGLGFKQSAPMGSRVAAAVPAQPRARTERGALKVVAGNDYEGGLFAPIVVVARNVIGVKRFNQIRGKARALLRGQTHVTIDDIKALAQPTLRHRILVNYRAEAEGVSVDKVIDKLVEEIAPPAGA